MGEKGVAVLDVHHPGRGRRAARAAGDVGNADEAGDAAAGGHPGGGTCGVLLRERVPGGLPENNPVPLFQVARA